MHALKSRTTPRLALPPRAESLISILVGVSLGALVIGGFLLFWVNSSHLESNTTDLTVKQSSGLSVLNRISRDVSDASAVAYAQGEPGEPSMMVLDHADGSTLDRVVWGIDAQSRVYRVLLADEPSMFDPTNPELDEEHRRQYVADDVRPAVDGSAFFTYIDADGDALTAGELPAFNPGLAAGIKRVDIAFAAKAGSGEVAYVELHTSASLASGPAGAVDPHLPACPLPVFTQGDPYPIIEWNMTGQTTEFQVFRGTEPAPVLVRNATTATEVYRYSDPTRAGTTTPTDYQVLAIGPGGTSTNCGKIRWYPRLATPQPTAQLLAAATESPQWGASTQATVSISWAPVANAFGYEVYRRPMTNAAPFTGLGSYSRVGLITSPATTSWTDPGPLAWDEGYQYHVVANGPMPEASLPSPGMKVLTHSKIPVTSVMAEPVNYNQNRVRWVLDPGETATGLAVYRRDLSGCYPSLASWTRVNTSPLALDQTSYADNTAQVGTRYEYAVGAYNLGPRGGNSDLQYASLLSSTDTALQFPANPTTTASGSFTGGPSRAALTTGFTAFNVGISNVAWTPGCASTTDTYRLDLYGNTRTTVQSSREMGTATSWTDPGWNPRATERNYKAVAFNDTGASPNDADATGIAGAYQYSNAPGAGSISEIREEYTVYSGYTDDKVQPAGAVRYCSWTPVDVDDSYWEGRYEQVWVPPTYKDENHWHDTSHQATGHGTEWRHGHAPTAGSHWHSHGENHVHQVVDQPGYYKDVWNPQYKWHPDSDGDLEDYQWWCKRYRGGYTVNWNESADTGESNAFCNAGRGGCSATVYWTDTGSPRETTQSGAGPYSQTYYWYTALIDGHDYSYTVSQPQGTISCNVGGCASSAAPTTCSSNCSPAASPTSLTGPAFGVVGSDTNNDKVADALGTNRVMWNAVAGATGYRVYRYSTYSGGNISTGSRTLVYDGTGASCNIQGYRLCFSDTGRARGTESYYKIASYNAASTVESSALKAAYQAPATTTLTNTKMPTIDDAIVGWSWTKTADAGQPASGKFCASAQNLLRGKCEYQLAGYDTINAKNFKTWDLGADIAAANLPQPWGKTLRYTLNVCNKGGCVAAAGPTVPTWPGPFTVSKHRTDQRESRGNKWYGGTVQQSPRQQQMATLTWDVSKGATNYKFGFLERADDPFNRVFPAGYTGTVGTAFNAGTATDSGSRRVTPGARYTYTVWATAENGKQRQAEPVVYLSQPPKPMFGEVARFCKPGDPVNTLGWKAGYRFHAGGTSTDTGGTGVTRDIGFDRLRWAWWAGTVTDADAAAAGGDPGDAALRRIVQTRTKASRNDADWKPAEWDNNTEFWDSEFVSGGWVADNTIKALLLGNYSDTRIIPWRSRAWAAFQPYAWVDPTQTVYDLGDNQTQGNVLHVGFDEPVPSACNATGSGWQWNGTPAIGGRWADLNSSPNYFSGPAVKPFGVTR